MEIIKQILTISLHFPILNNETKIIIGIILHGKLKQLLKLLRYYCI